MSQHRSGYLWAAVLLGFPVLAGPAMAEPIRVGITVSMTGPAASLGIPHSRSVALMPKQIDGQDVEYFVLDDGTDASRAVANARKLIDEDHVDILFGSSVTPGSLAMIDVAAEKQVPMISLAASQRIIAPMDAQRHWVFKTPQNDSLMATAVVDNMVKAGLKSVAFIGFNDAYGDGWLDEFTKAATPAGIKITTVEKFARPDTSVTGQVLKMIASHPDAMFIAGAGTPAALPEKTLRERGWKGPVYQTHGVANSDFLRVGGKDVEGTILPSGPILVASQLPDSNPIKAVALDYIHRYEAVYGPGSVSNFGADADDAMLMMKAAIPEALSHGKPGTPEFRAGLRDGLEHLHEVVLNHGITTMTATDHSGFDTRARVLVVIQDGTWKLLP